MSRPVVIVKCVVLVSVAILLSTSTILKSGVLHLTGIRLESDTAAQQDRVKDYRESEKARRILREDLERIFENQTKRFEDDAAKRAAPPTPPKAPESTDDKKSERDQYQEERRRQEDQQRVLRDSTPLQRPVAPNSVEFEDRLVELYERFTLDQARLFEMTHPLNWLVGACSLTTVLGLLWLILFDANGPRVAYAITLAICFAFLIGPSMHFLLSLLGGWAYPPTFGPSYYR